MLALIGATTLVIVAVILFGLWYVSQTMGTTAHRTAIESAALAAAGDLGRIVVFTPTYGYVSLTGLAPIGTSTNAKDNFYRQVHSINELLAAARLDMIIADDMGDQSLKNIASNDAQNILKVKDTLVTALQNACQKGGSGTDVYGNKVTPYDDALNIYLSNQAIKSSYVQGSFKLTMGSINGGVATGTIVPQESKSGRFNNMSVPSADQINGYYRSDMDIPYSGTDFVFGAVSRQVALADTHKFATSIASLPYQIPCAVQVAATQEFQDQGIKQQTNFTACATAGGSFKTPAPGAFTISFPDGPMDEYKKPEDIEYASMADGKKPDKDIQMTVKEAIKGDFPVDAAKSQGDAQLVPPVDWTSPPNNSTMADVYRATLYDWLRAEGSTANVDSAVDMMKTQFSSPSTAQTLWASLDVAGNPYTLGLVPTGVLHIYEWNSDGSIQYRHKDVQPDPYLVVSMGQMYAESNQLLQSNTKQWEISVTITAPRQGTPTALHTIHGTNRYDIYVRDQIHQHGTGEHDGEPCDSPTISHVPSPARLAWANDGGSGGSGADLQQLSMSALLATVGSSVNPKGSGLPPMLTDGEDFALTVTSPLPWYVCYKDGPAGGAPRITYTTDGIASEIRFRRQIDIHDLNLLLGDRGYIGLMTQPAAGATKGTSIDPDTVTATSTTDTSTTSTTSTSTGNSQGQ
jgi:hypothetical protein